MKAKTDFECSKGDSPCTKLRMLANCKANCDEYSAIELLQELFPSNKNLCSSSENVGALDPPCALLA